MILCPIKVEKHFRWCTWSSLFDDWSGVRRKICIHIIEHAKSAFTLEGRLTQSNNMNRDQMTMSILALAHLVLKTFCQAFAKSSMHNLGKMKISTLLQDYSAPQLAKPS
jgi:hypothetical protein